MLSGLPASGFRLPRAAEAAALRLLRIAVVVATGTLAVCGVKAPPRPPLTEAAPDAGAATFAECPPEAREAYATARFECGNEAQMLPGCTVSCAADAGAADEERDVNGDAGSDAGGARPDERAPARDGGSR